MVPRVQGLVAVAERAAAVAGSAGSAGVAAGRAAAVAVVPEDATEAEWAPCLEAMEADAVAPWVARWCWPRSR